LCPPPRNRAVMRPMLLRPPDFLIGASSGFSGSLRVISAKSDVVMKRREGVYGRYFLLGMSLPPSLREALELLDLLTGLEGHDGLEPVLRAAREPAEALDLAAHLDEVHLRDVDVEDRLDGLLDLDAVRLRVHVERVLAVLHGHDGLLRQDRGDDDVVRVHRRASPSNRAASATTRSARSTS